MDLRQYGLDWSLNADSSIAVPADFAKRINSVNVNLDTVSFSGVNPNSYKLGTRLGGGTFGEVFECTRLRDGLKGVIKIAKSVDPYALIKEALIQIIIVDVTKDKKHPEIDFYGPYAPILYDIAYEPTTGTGYIVSQQMRKTIHASIWEKKDPPLSAELPKMVGRALIQVSTMLEELGKMLNFNHRDFKTDNCMYFRDSANKVQVRLIDFGFSTITYNKMSISGKGIGFKHKYLPTRDMTQFMYELYAYHKYIPDALKAPLEDLLTFPNYGTVCKLYKGCGKVQSWRNTYTFLNSDIVMNPNGNPHVVKQVFLKVQAGLPYKLDLAYEPGMQGLFVAKPSVPIVPPNGKVYNPDTGRYVLATGAVGRKLLAEVGVAKDKGAVVAGIGLKKCPPLKPDFNPNTRRCVKACPSGKKRDAAFKCVTVAAAAAGPQKCPPAKPDYNPKTRRCLKACSSGKKRDAAFKCVTVQGAHSPKIKACPADKPDYNPMTKRCVKSCPPGKKRDGMFKCVSDGTRRTLKKRA
jgi:hypothetical protein